MTVENIEFCKEALQSPSRQATFFELPWTLQARAQVLLDRWDALTPTERHAAIRAGTCAVALLILAVVLRSLQAIAPEHPHLPALSLALLRRQRSYLPRAHSPSRRFGCRSRPRPCRRSGGICCATCAQAFAVAPRRRRRRSSIRSSTGCGSSPSDAAGVPAALSVSALSAMTHAMIDRGLASSTIHTSARRS